MNDEKRIGNIESALQVLIAMERLKDPTLKVEAREAFQTQVTQYTEECVKSYQQWKAKEEMTGPKPGSGSNFFGW